jgi:hypothetical protein
MKSYSEKNLVCNSTICVVKPKVFNVSNQIILYMIVVENQSDVEFRVKWICFSCGRTCKSRRALYSHLSHCYWHSKFRTHIEDAPFYRRIPSKQLRYYYRNRPDLLKQRKERRKRMKDFGILKEYGKKRKIGGKKFPKILA